MKIDTHHHFWRYNLDDYGWISDDMEVLRRNYLPDALEDAISQVGISEVISVQARQKLEETEWLLDLAAEHDFIAGVVGWVPLTLPSVGKELERLAGSPKLKAVRHVLHDEPDDRYMLREDFNQGISLLDSLGLAYDILIFEKHLPQTMEFVDRHPYQRFIVDHLAKPRIRDGLLSPWRDQLKELAQRENVYCKMSGVVTEADVATWTEAEIWPYLDITLEAFEPQRLMFGSDWPVCLSATTYEGWFDVASRFIGRLSASEQERVWSATAKDAYRL